MRLVAIYNIWDDWDWLEISTRKLEKLVDGFIIIASERSNYGELSPIPEKWRGKIVVREPQFNHPLNCETDKRNFGLSLAKKENYTHFLSLDSDELYEEEPFLKAKERFKDPELEGLVCATQVYFKSPNLTIGLDTTRVPFIHKLTPFTKHEFNRQYPYAWDGHQIKIDPSRSLNINSGVKWDEIIMHHYSHCRKDYEKKIRNSTAKSNLQRSSILTSYRQASAGKYCDFYRKSLVPATVDFGIHETTDGFVLKN